MLYRASGRDHAAVIKYDEVRLPHPDAAWTDRRAPHDPRPRRSRRREEAPADVPALRDPRALHHAAGDDAADLRAACDRAAGEDPRSPELRGSRSADQQVSRFLSPRCTSAAPRSSTVVVFPTPALLIERRQPRSHPEVNVLGYWLFREIRS